MTIKAVYFDYGRVLANDSDGVLLKYLAKEASKPVDEVGRVFGEELRPLSAGRIQESEFWKNMIMRLNLAKNPSDFSNLFYEVYREGLAPRSDILDIAKKLKIRGLVIGILSNITLSLLQICREKDYYSGFEPLILSAEVGYAKPEKGIYEVAAERLDLPPHNILFIDDKKRNLEVAEKLGWQTIQFNNRFETASYLERKLIDAGIRL